MATKPSLLLKKFEQYAPDCYKQIMKIAASFDKKEYPEVLKREYSQIEKVSVDYGLFEKLQPGSQWEIPANIGWVDLGTWELIYHGLPKDKEGNISFGKVEFLETKNSENCLRSTR